MKRENFVLKKLQANSKGVSIAYTIEGSEGKYGKESKVSPHPDMIKTLEEFVPIMTDILGMEERQSANFTINGITVSTMKSMDQVIVSSSYECSTGHKIAVNSHNVLLEGTDYVNQGKLRLWIDRASDEAYEYLFKNKTAQLDLNFPIDEAEQEEEDSSNIDQVLIPFPIIEDNLGKKNKVKTQKVEEEEE